MLLELKGAIKELILVDSEKRTTAPHLEGIHWYSTKTINPVICMTNPFVHLFVGENHEMHESLKETWGNIFGRPRLF